MANEIAVKFTSGKTLYAQVRNATGSIWRTDTLVFTTYATADIANYKIALTEQGSASGFYVGTFPSQISGGVYNIIALQQAGGSPAETDSFVGSETFQWNGSNSLPLFDLATSGQIGQNQPVRLARGVMVQNFPLYLKSAADHITPFTSGTLSGQIARDGGSFGALQSGAFTETGLGWYSLQALTSGDLVANTIKLHFTAVGISGGASDPLPMAFVMQKVSGVA